jgi:hypothetical protein
MKFDEHQILETAASLRLLSFDPGDPHEGPRVADEDAEDFFYRLCQVSSSGNCDLIPATISHYFYQDRVKYFATSAIGRYVDERTGKYNPDDYQNYISNPDGSKLSRIGGAVYPINVVEPLLWIGQGIAATRH